MDKPEERLMAHYIEPLCRKNFVTIDSIIQTMFRNFIKHFNKGGSFNLTDMEEVLNMLTVCLGFPLEESISFEFNSNSFELEKTLFNSWIKTDALIKYPYFFRCRFLHLKIERFFFQNEEDFKKNPEIEITKWTIFQFLDSLLEYKIESIK